LVPVSNALFDAGQASDLKDATCGKPANKISRARLPGSEAQHTLRPGRPSGFSPIGPRYGPHQESTRRNQSASEGDSGDANKAKSPQVRLSRRGAAIRCKTRPPPAILNVNSNNEDEVEATQHDG
jgi:hypothetical protein